MKPVALIQDPVRFNALIHDLAGARFIAIDTESNSFYAYFERVCLIQISTDEEDYILDPLALRDLSPLGEVLQNPGSEKIFHAASNDVLGLKRDFQFVIRNIFDTAVACKLLGYKHLGLAAILKEHYDVELNKKWQRHDWGKRPLSEEQLSYARLDTHYLIPLRHQLAEELQAGEQWDAARQAFEKASEQQFQEKTFQPESFIQIHGARSLDSTGKRILKALYLYREYEARRQDRAPFRILPNETLVRLADRRPKNFKDFSNIKGLPKNYQKTRGAHNLLELIKKTEDHGEVMGNE